MCTALTWGGYFGRNLDLEYAYDETITLTPRYFPLPYRFGTTDARHYAILGVAYVAQGYPLYYDALNEAGLAMAGLHFSHSACYGKPVFGKRNLASFELIPQVLGNCGTLADAAKLLRRIQLTTTAFSAALPPSPLHWMLADRSGALVLEMDKTGLHLYKNPVGVLTNEPPFPMQMQQLTRYMALSPKAPENSLIPGVKLPHFSRGLGAIGLPGDLSSPSRFVRAVFTRCHAASAAAEQENIQQFFHILQTVAQTKGCVQLSDGSLEYTRYTCCCDLEKGVYYYNTYHNSQLRAVSLHREKLDSSRLITYPLAQPLQINWQNGTSPLPTAADRSVSK